MTASFTRRGAASAQPATASASPAPARRGRRAAAEEAPPAQTTAVTVATAEVVHEQPRFRGGPAPSVAVVAPDSRSAVPMAPVQSQWATHRAKQGQLVGEFSPSDMGSGIVLQILSEKSPDFRDLRDWVDQWVLGKQFLVGPEAFFIVTKLTKRYQEDTEYDSGQVGQVWETSAEAAASGKKFSDFVIADILLESPSPDTDSLVENIAFDGKGYIPAVLYLRKSSMSVVRGLLKDLEEKGPLKGDLASHVYRAVPERHEKAGSGSNKPTVWFTPKLTIEEPVSPEGRELIAQHLGV